MSEGEAAVGAIPLDTLDLVLAGALVLVAGVISVALRLGLGRRLALASVRTIVQLLLLGYVLEWIFALERAVPVLGLVGLMLMVAGREAVRRSERTYRFATVEAIGSLALTGVLTTVAVTEGIIGISPWFDPQYVLPILGMILGNALNGISLCLDKLLESLDERRDLVEADLALGATRWEAARDAVADSVRRGMIPILNAMMVVGIVSLPGMMTGQILAGADPLDAVKYQIVVMCMLAAATALGSMMVALLAFRRLFNERHQLRAERIQTR
ncbi:MAG: ABC transporter permease [Myxococcota bacterium]